MPALEGSRGEVGGRHWFVNGHGMTLVEAPAGTVTVAGPKAGGGPPLRLTLPRPLFVCDREVTVGQFRQFVTDPDHPAAEKPPEWKGPTRSVCPTDDCPVDNVSWYDALRFCNWLSDREGRRRCYRQASGPEGGGGWECDFGAAGYRLPTEEEWDYVCRAGAATTFAFGEDADLLPAYGSLLLNSRGRVWPAGTRLPSAWGLFDTYGNLDEWCWDRYRKEWLPGKDAPPAPPEKEGRVVRGGNFFTGPGNSDWSGTQRGRADPDGRVWHVWFRVVCLRAPPPE